MWFRKAHNLPLEKSLFGLHFAHPLDFATLAPSKEELLKAASKGKRIRFLELTEDVEHLFSLLYDFTDLVVIPTSAFERVDAPDLYETLDAILSTRLLYDHWIPLVLRIAPGQDEKELDQMIAYCRLSGIDGLLVPGLGNLRYVLSATQGRIPLLSYAHLETPEDAAERLREGAVLVDSGGKKPTWIREALQIIANHD